MNKINLKEKFELIDQYWDPKIIGEVNNMHVKLAKINGEFEYHKHLEDDELFFIVEGKLTMKYRNSEEVLKKGELVIVPKGVEHKPVAEEETLIMLFESKQTVNTGDKESQLTKRNLKWI
ncbi:MAG: cupin domain-containing protein [Halanaerobiales bacterium]|nr:cupin domain-containing protein [Halanaerobiales bacterium]